MTRVTIKDVAREAGVSTTLVSVVLNARRREDGSLDCDINADTAARVLAIVEKMGYRRNKAAAGLRSGKHYTLGLITPDIGNATFAEIGRAFENAASEKGYTVMYGSSEERADRLEELLDAVIATGVDGLAIIPCAGCLKAVERAVSLGIPTVLSNRDLPELEGVGRVSIDHARSVSNAVHHLYDGGYRKIEYISEKMPVSSIFEREAGYTAAMISLGLEPVIHGVETLSQQQEVFEIVKDAAARGVEALIAPRIMLTFHCLEAIDDLGLKMPDDLALVGADDSPVFFFHRPTVTFMSHSASLIGEKTFELLYEMMGGVAPYRVIIDPELHIGQSTASKKTK